METPAPRRQRHWLPTRVGCAAFRLSLQATNSIIIPTQLSALAYGLAWKIGDSPEILSINSDR
ncbi:hypothetical protein B9037_017005 [Klebsiella aerogenes]|nr:hypothetical protein B9037_017005 [Klebsiella aerogenes]